MLYTIMTNIGNPRALELWAENEVNNLSEIVDNIIIGIIADE